MRNLVAAILLKSMLLFTYANIIYTYLDPLCRSKVTCYSKNIVIRLVKIDVNQMSY